MLELVIGNKNYSSWSMRPWVLMKQLGIAFTERKLRFDFDKDSAFYKDLARFSPAGLVPVLLDDGFAVWDTLAIAEYLSETHPGVWPSDAKARARARSVSAEMHSGFSALRNHCGQNIEARLPDVGQKVLAEQAAVRDNLARLDTLWTDCLQASGGPFLFGEFCAADAFYAPVVGRLRTYGLPVSAGSQAYADRVWALPAVLAWVDDALAEKDFLQFEEAYRTSRD